MNKAVVVIVALALASSAYGMVFSWNDSSGIKHFTNKRDEIPERYRAKAKPLYPEQNDMLPGPQNAPPQPVKVEVPPTVPLPVQQAMPLEPSKSPQPVAAPVALTKTAEPVTGRINRRRSPHTGEE
jgi:hypothetical protein